MSTEIRSYIASDGINPGGYDYVFTSLANWWASPNVFKNIISADERHTAVLKGETHSGAFAMASPPAGGTDATHHYMIDAETGAEFDGQFSNLAGKAVVTSSASNNLFSSLVPRTIVRNLTIRGNTRANNVARGLLLQAFACRAHGVGVEAIKGTGTSAEATGIRMIGNSGEVSSCVSQDIGTSGAAGSTNILVSGIRTSGDSQVSSNNTTGNISAGSTTTGTNVANGFNVVSVSGSGHLKNNASGRVTSNGTKADYDASIWTVGVHSNNASEDATAPGSNPITGITLAGEIADATAADFDATPIGQLIDAGLDLTGIVTETAAANLVTRPQGAAWDIGACEAVPVVDSVKGAQNLTLTPGLSIYT